MGAIRGAICLFLFGWSSAFADLDSLRSLQLSGFNKEPEDLQKHFLQQAELYREYRKGRGRDGYFKDCSNSSPLPKPFCQLEEGRLQVSIARKLAKLEKRRSKITAQLTKSVMSLDEKALQKLSAKEIRSVIGSIRNFKDVETLGKKTLTQNSCAVAYVAFGLAIKSEEKFPEQTWVSLSEPLYRKAAECLQGEDGAYARFRAGLLSVWMRGCDGMSDWLQPILEGPEIGDALQVRARYWQHYCGLKLNDAKAMKAKKEELKNLHPMSFHNLLVNRESPLKKKTSESPNVIFRSVKKTEVNLLAQGLEALLQIDAPDDWLGELAVPQSAALAESEPEFQLYIAVLLERAQQGLAKFKILGQLLLSNPESVVESSLKMYFPIWYFDTVVKYASPVDPFLVMGLIRQESAFNPKAQSAAGARGLMQVMPYTARAFGIRQKQKLLNPDVSVRVGSKFLEQRLRQFSGDVELTLASYNAGPARVNEWIKRYPVDHRMLFLDLIPYRETRDYVTLILRNYLWYSKMYSGRHLYDPEERKLAVANSTFALKFTALSQEETLSAR